MTTTASAESVQLDIAGLESPLTLQVHASGDTIISERLRMDRCWEPYETQLLLSNFEKGEVFVDVGANIGYYTLLAAQRTGTTGAVFAYEPDHNNFALLKQNVEANGFTKARLFPLALSDRNQRGKLFLSDNNFGDHRIYADDETRKSSAIDLVHGDEHLGEQVGRVDFLKIDTQGAEYFVVNGLRQLIARNRKHLRMILEFSPYGIRHSGADGHQLIALLESFKMQYHIIDHIDHRLIPAQAHHLSEWVEELAQQPDNEGFINLFVTPEGYPVAHA